MKKYFIAFVCAGVALVACNKEIKQDSSFTKTFSITREIPGSDDSKAALDGNNVVFSADDAISVFDGTSNNKFTTTESGATVTFSGEAADADRYLILSPYTEDATLQSASVVNITIPDVQVATPGGVDPKALISAGIAEGDGTVTLYNAVGLVKIVVPAGKKVKNIQIGGGRGATVGICGTFDFNVSTLTLAPVDMKTIITLVPAEGNEFIAPGSYYVAVRPKPDYDIGLVIAYLDENNVLSKRKTPNPGTVMIYRSHIVPMGSLDSNYTSVTGTAVLRGFGDYGTPWQFTGFVKKIAGGTGTATADDNVVKKIIFKSHSLYRVDKATSQALVSSGAGNLEIFAYLEGDVVYVVTEAPKITLNSTSANLFRNFRALEEVIFDDMGAMANTSFNYMFRNCDKLERVDFGNADLSNVKDFSFMFVTNNLKEVNFGETATTAATTMQSMFSQSLNLRKLYLGKNFTLPPANQANNQIDGMFNGTASTTTTILDEEGHGLQCKFYASQALWDALNVDLNADGVNSITKFNKNRFYFIPVE